MWPTSSGSGSGSSSERVLSTTGRGKKQGQNLLPGSKKALRNALIKEKRAQRATRTGAAAKGEDGGLGFDVQSLVEDLIKAARQINPVSDSDEVDEGEAAVDGEDLDEDDDGPAEEDRVTALGAGALEAFSTPPLSRYGRQVALAIGGDFQSSFVTQEIGKGAKRCIVYIPRSGVELTKETGLTSVSISRARQRAHDFARQASGEAFDASVDYAKSLKNAVRDKHKAQKLAGKKFLGKLRKIFVKRSEKKDEKVGETETSERISEGVVKLTINDEVSHELEEEEEEDEEDEEDEDDDDNDGDTKEENLHSGLGSIPCEETKVKAPEWEIYTRGIGSRLLSKMGFVGGPLGVNRGMSRLVEPIEAIMKNNKKGLGMEAV
jgi:hypothetical protein